MENLLLPEIEKTVTMRGWTDVKMNMNIKKVTRREQQHVTMLNNDTIQAREQDQYYKSTDKN